LAGFEDLWFGRRVLLGQLFHRRVSPRSGGGGLCKQALPDKLLLVLADGHLGDVRHLCAPPLLHLYRGPIILAKSTIQFLTQKRWSDIDT